ncbi:hypothetical protein DFH09DRAFT_1278913 [Mycena vulgaris]|nr:hypothetical protein DFH09DRAFT_1278913 [Mycena vulgaris]
MDRFSELRAALKAPLGLRGRQLGADDIACLRDGAKLKVPGTVLDVVGALLQLLGEKDGRDDFAVFSTWLSALISKKVPQNEMYGTIMDHIENAAHGQKEMLLAKARWLIPLYGSDPPHWVLGWVDQSTREMHIFDSVPELQSYMWAEPALVEVAETIFTTLGKPGMDLAPWKVTHHSPPELQRQMNVYACGFFVIHAMRAIGNHESISTVTNDKTATVRSETLDMILENLFLLHPMPSRKKVKAVDLPAPQERPASQSQVDIPMVPVGLAASGLSESAPVERSPSPSQVDVPMVPVPSTASGSFKSVAAGSIARSKRKLDEPDMESKAPEKKAKSVPTNVEAHKDLLEANSNISVVEAHRVRCAACSTWVKLHATREFKLENWTQHETKCPAITGKRTVRTIVRKPTVNKIVPQKGGATAITAFFRPPEKTGSSQTTQTMPMDTNDSDSESTSNKGHTSYTSRLVNATPGIKAFFEPGPIKNPPPKPVVIIEPKSCIHLSGGKDSINGRCFGHAPCPRRPASIAVQEIEAVEEPSSYGGFTSRAQIPLPHIPPQVVALLPTDGKDDATQIVEQQLKLLKMAEELSLSVVSFAADGAASELAAQRLMDDQPSSFPPLTYDYDLYGIHLKAPVLKTGPVVSNQDSGHGKKTARNQLQSGTKSATLGEDVVVNETLIDLQATGESGLLPSDVNNVDKQDDWPARHLFHIKALQACTSGEGEEMKIKDGFGGLFVYLFVLGIFFDAWLNRTMTVANRVLAVLRARFFLHLWRTHIVQMSNRYPDLYSTARSFISPQSFQIFNRLCDSMLLLVIISARRYPNQPFFPWLLGTEFVEHFFGLARMMLPNFTYAEFLKMVQHVMVRQRILLSGSFKEKRERNHRVGSVLDFDASPLTAEDRKLAEVRMTDAEMNSLVKLGFLEASLICTQLLHIPAPKPTAQKPLKLAPLGLPTPKTKNSGGVDSDSEGESDDEDADEDDEQQVSEPFSGNRSSPESRAIALAAHDAARYSALCDDYENALNELDAQPPPPPFIGPLGPLLRTQQPVRSEFIDATGLKLSIPMMLQARLHWQAGTTTKSEKVSQIDSSYALARIARQAGLQGDDDTEPEKMTHQEASNLTRVLQDQNSVIQQRKPQKWRELRWRGVTGAIQRYHAPPVLPNISVKNVHQLNPLAIGSMVIVWNGTRFYIGEIFGLYKKGANSRYGSVPTATSAAGLAYLSLRVYLPLMSGAEDPDSDDEQEVADIVAPLFSCHYKNLRIRLHTHAKMDQLLFNLGRRQSVFEQEDPGVQHRKLTTQAAVCWISLTKPGAVSKEVKILTLKITWNKALILGSSSSPAPGRILHKGYLVLGGFVETHTNRIAHRIGLGPDSVAANIRSSFGTGKQRASNLDTLRSHVTPELEKSCSRLIKYTLPHEASSTQRRAFQNIVALITLFPGLRLLLLRSKHIKCRIQTTERIAAIWERSDNSPDEEWEFWRAFAATCLSDLNISSILEQCSTLQLTLCGPGLSVIERLIVAHDYEVHRGDDSRRYLGGILALPGFWSETGTMLYHSIAKKLCSMMVQILQDLRVDIDLLKDSTEPEAPFDYEGVDLLADTILTGISEWLKEVDAAKWAHQLWYGRFLDVVRLLRRPRSATLLPNSFAHVTSEVFITLIPAYNEVQVDVICVGNQNLQGNHTPDKGDAPNTVHRVVSGAGPSPGNADSGIEVASGQGSLLSPQVHSSADRDPTDIRLQNTDSNVLLEASPLRMDVKAHKKEVERIQRQLGRERRALAEKMHREAARAVLQKRKHIEQTSTSSQEIEWSGGWAASIGVGALGNPVPPLHQPLLLRLSAIDVDISWVKGFVDDVNFSTANRSYLENVRNLEHAGRIAKEWEQKDEACFESDKNNPCLILYTASSPRRCGQLSEMYSEWESEGDVPSSSKQFVRPTDLNLNRNRIAGARPRRLLHLHRGQIALNVDHHPCFNVNRRHHRDPVTLAMGVDIPPTTEPDPSGTRSLDALTIIASQASIPKQVLKLNLQLLHIIPYRATDTA